MHVQISSNTCSQGELCAIYAENEEEFNSGLAAAIKDAKDRSRKSIIANCSPSQHTNHGPKLVKAGFKYVGKYYGNSSGYVYVYIWGLTAEPKKPVVRKNLLRPSSLKNKKAIR